MKGICFTEPMFHAVVEGRKFQTRRIIKPNPHFWADNKYPYKWTTDSAIEIKPRYKAGEKVYIKEPYLICNDFLQYKYDNKPCKNIISCEYMNGGCDCDGWENKLFMPEKYARYFIEIIEVRCERLQYISDEDCLEEGIFDHYDNEYKRKNGGHFLYENGIDFKRYDKHREAFAALFNKINGHGTWESNPYVWVYSFKLIN